MENKKIVQKKYHKILPKATLMRFKDNESQRIYYLDLNDITVKHIYPKSYHASPNYYNPEYDIIVKKHETAMGKLYKEIVTAIEHNEGMSICAGALKKQIIDFITVEFHRSVIANDSMLEKYKNKQQMENDIINSILFREGRMTAERSAYSVNYRQKAKSKEAFRNYAQNILGTKNQAISSIYRTFSPQILYIPMESDYHFLLPPLHFVGNDQFVCFILSPCIALALYPTLNGDSIISEASKEKAEIINLRILECASLFDPEYKEIVGKKFQLDRIKERIEKIMSIVTISESKIVVDANKELCLVDMYDVLETVIIFCLLFGVPEGTPKVQMRVQNFDAKFFESSQKEVSDLFKKYSFNLMVQ